MQKIKAKSITQQIRHPATDNRSAARGNNLDIKVSSNLCEPRLAFEEFEGDDRRGEEGNVGVCHALPEEAQIFVQSAHVVRASWPPEASLGFFISLIYPVQGKAIEQRSVLVVLAHLDKFAFPILVRLLEDREDRPPSNPVQAHPKAISWMLSFKKEKENVH